MVASRWIPRVLRVNRDFRYEFTSSLVSQLGCTMSMITFPLLVLHIGGSPTQAGLVATASLLTRLVLRLPAGYLVDRWDRRSIMLAADLVRFAALGSIPLVAMASQLGVGQLLVVAAIEGLATAAFGPASAVLIRDIVHDEQLDEALGLDQAALAVSALVGPAAGGALYGLDPILPFTVDALSYALSALLLWQVTPPLGRAAAGPSRGGITAGFRFLLRERILFGVLMYAAGLNFISAAIDVLLVIALQARGASGGQIGLVLSCAGIGAILGSLLAGWLARRLGIPVILFGVGFVWTAVLAAFAAPLPLLVVALLVLLLMTLSPATSVVVRGALLRRTPRHMVGRVTAATSTLLVGLTALGPVTAGVLFQATGTARSWLWLAAATVAVIALAWVPLRASGTLAPGRSAQPVPPAAGVAADG